MIIGECVRYSCGPPRLGVPVLVLFKLCFWTEIMFGRSNHTLLCDMLFCVVLLFVNNETGYIYDPDSIWRVQRGGLWRTKFPQLTGRIFKIFIPTLFLESNEDDAQFNYIYLHFFFLIARHVC